MAKQLLRILSVLVLIPVVLWSFSNAVVNQHNHKLVSGGIITHAHPYTPDSHSNTPFQSHSHSAFDDFVASQAANLLVVVVSLLCCITIFVRHYHFNSEFQYIQVPHKSYLYSCIFRGPPSVL